MADTGAPISASELDEWDGWLDRWFAGEYNPEPAYAPPEMVGLAHDQRRLIAEVRRLLAVDARCVNCRAAAVIWLRMAPNTLEPRCADHATGARITVQGP